MTKQLKNYHQISRDHWKTLPGVTRYAVTQDELKTIASLNDRISLLDVQEIYAPLTQLILIYQKAKQDLQFSKSLFLNDFSRKQPFIIGISGSVAVGKSTTSRLLQILLTQAKPDMTVTLVTTDGFLYPNHVLEAKGLLEKKGFPESYDMEALLQFLETIQKGVPCDIPVYSHTIYDILPNKTQTIPTSDIVILEGITIFQNPDNTDLYMTDYYDLSIYIDADEAAIENWFMERFYQLLDLAKDDPNSFYYPLSQQPLDQARELAQNAWHTINLPNLHRYIAPTKTHADIILHKNETHAIDTIYLKN